MGREEFERLVDAALDDIPDELAVLVRNVVVLVEDDAPADDPDLLGLYDGVALTERGGEPGPRAAGPDPGLPPAAAGRSATTRSSWPEEVRITVVHEVAHHFGIDDDRLHDLGYA